MNNLQQQSTIFFFFFSFFFIFFFFSISAVNTIGINYGQLGNNLPSPDKVPPLLLPLNISSVKLYDYNPSILRSLSKSSSFSLTIAIPNDQLSLLKTTSSANSWISSNLSPFLSSTSITSITIGNEVLSSNNPSLISDLLPAMASLHSALLSLPSKPNISITTPHSLSILLSSFPPSSATFRQELSPHLSPILSFLSSTNSPFLINAYPYFAYKSDSGNIDLNFVLFEENDGVQDVKSKLWYDNMLFAQIDAVHAALMAMGYGGLEVQISETGWPSKGDEEEVGATIENARKYNGNLMRIVEKKVGTPMRPECPLVVYVFALFNENMKPGPTSERNYGLFKPDGSPVYDLGIESSGLGFPPSPSQQSHYPGYMNFSSSSEEEEGGKVCVESVVLFCWAVIMMML